MTGPTSAGGGEDDRLWDELAAVMAGADPVPPEVVRAARDSFTWRTVDAELAELVYDSAAEEPGSEVVRGPEGPRLLTFEARSLTVEVEVTTTGARRRLVGQLLPPRQARITVRHQGGAATVEADALGRFRADDLPAGPSSLRCQLAGVQEGASVVTYWVVL